MKITHLFVIILLFAQSICFAQTPVKQNLNGTWKMTWTDRILCYECFKIFDYEKDSSAYTNVPVPLDLNIYMQKVNLADDPNIGLNALKNRWISEQYYQYYTSFEVSEEQLNKNIKTRLVFEHLDLIADIYLNGEHIGSHQNYYIPCIIDVTGKLKKGKNKLIVAIESGYYYTSGKELKDYFKSSARNVKWPWLRKPAYQFYWDWNTRLINVGITGDVYLECYKQAKIEQVVPTIHLSENLDTATVETRLIIDNVNQNKQAVVKVLIKETGTIVSKKKQLQTGTNDVRLSTKIVNPELWWPLGHGDQNFYHLKILCEIDDKIADSYEQRIGIRKIEICRPAHEIEGEYFMLYVNNRPIFCKGGNWVPPGLIYSDIDSSRIKTLLDLACESNFNFFRVNGVGTYPSHYFFNLCDEKGILVWQEFMFAGTHYPVEDTDFLLNVKNEVTHIVREYAYHPSLSVWCGNNEIELHHFNASKKREAPYPDYALFHFEIPRIINNEDPSRPYRPSSPYSSVIENPNSPIYGDQHPWGVTLDDGPDFWKYREYIDRFAIEGGVMGASTLATLKQFLPDDQEYIHSKSWDYHDNTFNLNNLLFRTCAYKSVEFWLGKTPDDLSFEEYITASSLLQAEGLREYVNNYRRRMFSSAAAVFWMYTDSWPVTHGWTIVDYYLRKKPSYYSIKRAFNGQVVIVVHQSDSIRFYGVNDTPEDWNGTLRYGAFEFSGKTKQNETKQVILPANSATILLSVSAKDYDLSEFSQEAVFARLENSEGIVISQHRLLNTKFKDIKFKKPKISIKRQGDYALFQSDSYVWGVILDINGEMDLPDNNFDLIPGIPYQIEWPEEKELPKVEMMGNEFLLNN